MNEILRYESLSERAEKLVRETISSGLSEYAFRDEDAVRRNEKRDRPDVIRTPFIRDTDKIIHCPYFNRYADKTQVFSFYRNDDISRRSLHVQLVSRIARTIGRALGLNLDLIEAISLGHDIGHTPFGHTGEKILDGILYEKTSLHFAHNIHSVRVFDEVYPVNLTLQVLDGIACHNGELELSRYEPGILSGFEEFDETVSQCCRNISLTRLMRPSTLEGCVMRISDIIAYLGKDRQDAEKAKLISNAEFERVSIGRYNAEIINNLVINVIENSVGNPYISMDEEHFEALKKAKNDNYAMIYGEDTVGKKLENLISPMMREMFDRLLDDLEEGREDSPVFTHHLGIVEGTHYERKHPYRETGKEMIVCDFIASMTDDYFVDLYGYLFPERKTEIKYIGYFE